MHIFSQILRIQTDVIALKTFTICDLDSTLKLITKNAVTQGETAKSANTRMCVNVMFVRLFSIRHLILNAKCQLELHSF
jgi:hypothetical protein